VQPFAVMEKMTALDTSKKILFYRDFHGFSGGHLKLRNYFDHINCIPGFRAQIHFSADSAWGADNPWNDMRDQVLPQWQPELADCLFLAGLDWLMLDPAQRDDSPLPIINLIQGLRHADPSDPRYPLLRHPAVRICVSREVEMAISATGQVNGPIWTIPNGIDLAALPAAPAWEQRGNAILIVGLKNQQLARDVAAGLQELGAAAELLLEPLPRQDFLERLAQAKVAVLLPLEREGFYLPALEAMALGCIVVCPDCVGNRTFCQTGINCHFPDYRADTIARAALLAHGMDAGARTAMLAAAAQTAQQHSLEQERASLHQLLMNMPMATSE